MGFLNGYLKVLVYTIQVHKVLGFTTEAPEARSKPPHVQPSLMDDLIVPPQSNLKST